MKVPTKKVLQEQIKKTNIASAVITAVLAVVSAVALASQTVDVWLSYMARNVLAQGNEVVLAPAFKELYTVQVRYLFAGMFVATAILSILLATKLRNNYEATLKKKISGYKWVFIGLTTAVSLVVVSLLSGISDLATLKLVGALVLVSSLLGWISEREIAFSGSQKWLAFGLSIFAGLMALLPLLANIVGTAVYGMERFSWSIYALSATLIVSFFLFGLNRYLHISGRKGWKEYLLIERNHLLVDLASKIVLGLIIIASLNK